MTSILKGCRLPDGPIHLLIDSTGLKVFGVGEWLQEKHGVIARRTWRKLHLAVDVQTGMVIASTLTANDMGDPSQVAALLDQVDAGIGSVTADGAYDGAPTYDAVAALQTKQDKLMQYRMEKADRLDEVTRQVGFAVWQLQVLESCSATYFVLLT